jgi:ribosomal protein S18 acetylase RimI-like enzyme
MTARPDGRPDPRASGVVIREYRPGDGDALRELWRSSGFRLLGDDDEGLATYVARNPGLFLVAVAESASGEQIVASAMGAWDGRRGWIYHVATAASHRRTGIAAALVTRIETGLLEVGAKRVNVLVRDESVGGQAFWTAVGYEHAASSQFAKNLRE